jgi:hypothetical protein
VPNNIRIDTYRSKDFIGFFYSFDPMSHGIVGSVELSINGKAV